MVCSVCMWWPGPGCGVKIVNGCEPGGWRRGRLELDVARRPRPLLSLSRHGPMNSPGIDFERRLSAGRNPIPADRPPEEADRTETGMPSPLRGAGRMSRISRVCSQNGTNTTGRDRIARSIRKRLNLREPRLQAQLDTTRTGPNLRSTDQPLKATNRAFISSAIESGITYPSSEWIASQFAAISSTVAGLPTPLNQPSPIPMKIRA